MVNRLEEKINSKIVMPVKWFMGQEKSGGIVLGLSVLIALILANSFLGDHYHHFFEQKLGFVLNDRPYLNYTLHHWINDGLMSIFFFVVGLELKREFIGGELANPRNTILPIGAAVGGMLMPALIYLVFNQGESTASGWGIPMATDIAFALAVVYLLGDKVPASVKVFLTTLAIVDDLGAVLIIAFFYTSQISLGNLMIGFCFLTLMFVANKLGVKNVLFYLLVSFVGVWTAFLLSGIHATIAAVLSAFMVPADSSISENVYVQRLRKQLTRFLEADSNDVRILEEEQVDILSRIKDDATQAIPPLQRLEHRMGAFVTFIVLPIFAIANAGVSFLDMDVSMLFSTHVTVGVALGLLVGKPLGVIGFTWILSKTGLAKLSEDFTMRRLFGVGFLAAIGFTMSMFVSTLALSADDLLVQAKVGIFIASIIGGVAGYWLLRKE